MNTESADPWERVPIEQLGEIAAAIEYRMGETERHAYGYNSHVGDALISIYEHHPELLLDEETLEEVRARIAPLATTGPDGLPL